MKAKRGRPKGSKNKPGHKAGGPRIRGYNFMAKVIKGAYNFFESPWK